MSYIRQYIKVTPENSYMLSKWRKAGGNVENGYLSDFTGKYRGIWNSTPPKNHTEISWEDFKKHILEELLTPEIY